MRAFESASEDEDEDEDDDLKQANKVCHLTHRATDVKSC